LTAGLKDKGEVLFQKVTGSGTAKNEDKSNFNTAGDDDLLTAPDRREVICYE